MEMHAAICIIIDLECSGVSAEYLYAIHSEERSDLFTLTLPILFRLMELFAIGNSLTHHFVRSRCSHLDWPCCMGQ